MFKSSRLSLVSSHPLEYFRPGDALLDRDNVGLVLLLRPADAGGQPEPSDFFCVANTHLLYNPRRGDIKLAQLAILLAEIARLSRLPDGSSNPAVVCGDFNSVPWSPLYCLLTQGSLEFQGLPIGMVRAQHTHTHTLCTPQHTRRHTHTLGTYHLYYTVFCTVCTNTYTLPNDVCVSVCN